MGALKATVIRDLYARFYHTVKASGSDTLNAAFQCLVWEITHENTNAQTAAGVLGQLDLGKGAFQLKVDGNNNNAGVFGAANSMLAELGGSSDDDFRFFSNGDNLRGLRHDTAQDQILVVPISCAGPHGRCRTPRRRRLGPPSGEVRRLSRRRHRTLSFNGHEATLGSPRGVGVMSPVAANAESASSDGREERRQFAGKDTAR